MTELIAFATGEVLSDSRVNNITNSAVKIILESKL